MYLPGTLYILVLYIFTRSLERAPAAEVFTAAGPVPVCRAFAAHAETQRRTHRVSQLDPNEMHHGMQLAAVLPRVVSLAIVPAFRVGDVVQGGQDQQIHGS
eukprot:COSAG01_NODE_10613_length_2119_cov_2.440653_2_plen_101_part_00